MGSEIQKVAVVGTGVIGASWSALFLAKGLDVIAFDPADGAERTLREYIANAWPAMDALGQVTPLGSPSRLSFSTKLEDIADADFVQENGPERLAFKQDLYRHLDQLLPPVVMIATSSSGKLASSQAMLTHVTASSTVVLDTAGDAKYSSNARCSASKARLALRFGP